MRSLSCRLMLCLLAAAVCAGAAERPKLADAMAALRVPPPWLDSVRLDFDTSKPWKNAWDRIEKLLEASDAASRRKAVKLAYVYQSRGQAKEGYPAAVYFLAGEYAWALQEHRKLATKNAVAHERMASIYRHFGEHEQALAALGEALKHLPAPPWQTHRHGKVLEAKGDVYADMGETAKARAAYRQAVERFRETRLPANLRHVVPRSIACVEGKLELLERSGIAKATLRDGVYTGSAFGYSDRITATVTVRGGRIADVKLEHREKADLGAKHLLPQRILEAQSLDIDGITGATITSDAILSAVFRALKQAAGL